MNFSVAVLTAPRPQSTLARTLKSLEAGGFNNPVIFDGSPPPGKPTSISGCTAAYIALFRQELQHLRGDGLLVFEDDVVVCRGLREYLESIPWPEEQVNKIAMVSPYCPTAYSNYATFGRWHREDQRVTLAGTQAHIYTRHIMQLIVNYLDPTTNLGVDVLMGWLAQQQNMHIWYHVPSLVQHIGICNSSVGYTNDCGTCYSAETFRGEDFDARSLL